MQVDMFGGLTSSRYNIKHDIYNIKLHSSIKHDIYLINLEIAKE